MSNYISILVILLTPSKSTSTPSSPITSPPGSTHFPDLNPSQPFPLIIRATNGKGKAHREQGEKVKLSTIVQPDQLEKFFVRYAEVMKSGMSSLKKRDRSGRKKKKDKETKKKVFKDDQSGNIDGD